MDVEENIVVSRWQTIPIPTNKTVTAFILERSREEPDRTALIDGLTGESFTYCQLEKHVHALAAGLAKHGLTQRAKLALCAPDSLDGALLLLAVPLIGASITTLNPNHKSVELEKIFVKNPPDYMVTTPELAEKFSSCSSSVKKMIMIGNAQGYISVRDIMESGKNLDLPIPHLDPTKEPAFIHYSSGTTGLPKGVLLSHYNLIAAVIAACTPDSMFTGSDTFIVIFPLSHIGGSTVCLLSGLFSLSTLVLFPHFDVSQYLEASVKYKATVALLNPTAVIKLMNDPLMDSFHLSTLKRTIIGGAPLTSSIQGDFTRKIKTSCGQTYGMTELAGLTHLDYSSSPKPGSSGLALPNISTKIVDPKTGETLSPTKTGELWMRGPQVMLGYLNASEYTKFIKTDDGWIKTGDIAYHDEEGHIYIIDRMKDLIKFEGLQVSPAELEGVLLGHPLVTDAAVIGIENLKAGELPKAYVVLTEGTTTGPDTELDIINYVSARVAPWKRLRGGISFIDTIPKLASGKILKRLLRELEGQSPH